MRDWEYVERLRLALDMPIQGNINSKRKIWQLNYNESKEAFNHYPGRYIVTGMFIPSEIITAMNYPYIPTEPLAVSIGMMNYNKGLIERTEAKYEGMQLCSAIEIMQGMFLEEMIPPPGAVVLSSYMCEDAQKMYEAIARQYKCPSFFLDIPFNVEDDQALLYVKQQLLDLSRFLEEYTGHKLDPDSLKQAVSNSNKANVLRQKVLDLRAKYQLTRVNDVFPIYPLFTKFGKPEVVDIYTELYKEMQIKINEERYFQPRYRILWLGMIPVLSNKFMKKLENNFNIGIALEENSIFSMWSNIDENDPWEDIARKTLSFHPLGTVNRRVRTIMEYVNRFNIDGVIHFSHQGCRVYNGGVSFLHKELTKNQIPFIELNGDILDHRNFAEEVFLIRLEAFLELLEAKKG